MKPNHFVARAEALAAAGKLADALRLLRTKRGTLRHVPAFYDATLGRLACHAGNSQEAAEYLGRARDAYGTNVPADLRRQLIDMLLQCGRVESAGCELSAIADGGGTVTGVVRLASVEAYRHRRLGEPLDSGDPTPHRVLAQARVLAETTGVTAAASLLAHRRDDWETVPAPYDEALGRWLFRTGDLQAAIVHLKKAREILADDMPARACVPLATALYKSGDVYEAGRELSLDVQRGERIRRPALRLAINRFRDKSSDFDCADKLAVELGSLAAGEAR